MTNALIGIVLLAIGGSGAHGAAPAAHPAVLIPEGIDLGERAPDSTTPSRLWLCNTADTPLDVVDVKGSCGCTAVVFEPAALPPNTALEIPFDIRAPKAHGRHKTVKITVTMKDHPPRQFEIRLSTTADDLVPEADVIADPRVADLGPVRAGNLLSASVHLVNLGHVTRQVTATRAACECTTFPDFSPFALPPGEEADVHLELEVPATTAGRVTKDITVVVAGQPPVKVPLRMLVIHPRVEAVLQRLAERYPDTYVYDEFRIDDDVVTAVAWTPDRSRPAARVTCRFDEEGRIERLHLDKITPHRRAREAA